MTCDNKHTALLRVASIGHGRLWSINQYNGYLSHLLHQWPVKWPVILKTWPVVYLQVWTLAGTCLDSVNASVATVCTNPCNIYSRLNLSYLCVNWSRIFCTYTCSVKWKIKTILLQSSHWGEMFSLNWCP